jgi:transcriptional regulator with XRE-family HTH domain
MAGGLNHRGMLVSTTFLEKVTTTLEPRLGIVRELMRPADPSSDPKVRKRLAEYVSYWITQNGWTKALDVEKRAKKLGVSEGVSDATVGNILNQKEFKFKVSTLYNLAVTLGRPPEELFMLAIGKVPNKDVDEEIVSLAEIYKHLPESERGYFGRQIKSMIKEMSTTE